MDFYEKRKIFDAKLSARQFNKLAEYIYNECGIKLNASKKIMLEGRLRKRLKALDMKNFDEYCDFLFSAQGRESETIFMIDVVTTNKTDFFREPDHFEFLVKSALPDMMTKLGSGVNRKLMVWSAGCSTGEEPYTLAMVLADFSEKYPGLDLDYMILGTDISCSVLEHAASAIYQEERVRPVTMDYKKRFLMKSRNPSRRVVRIAPEIRNKVKFRRLNFLEGDFGMREPLDIVFCRNVVIYFDKDTQYEIFRRIVSNMRSGGYLFIGHSENISGFNLPLENMYPTVFRKR